MMESHEVTIGGKTKQVRAVRGLCGHNILRYHIHGRKQIPFVTTSTTARVEEGEVFAIETFGSTGKGYLRDDAGVYGYGRQEDVSAARVQSASARALLKTIDASFGPIVFCRRYLERLGVKSYHLGVSRAAKSRRSGRCVEADICVMQMKHLIEAGIVEMYPPLVDVKGTYVAQFEHVRNSAASSNGSFQLIYPDRRC